MGNVCVPIAGSSIDNFLKIDSDAGDDTPLGRRDSHKVLTWMFQEQSPIGSAVVFSHATKFFDSSCYVVLHVSPSEPNECGTIPLPVVRLLEKIASAVCAVDIPTFLPNNSASEGRRCQMYLWSGKACSSVTRNAALVKAQQLRVLLSPDREARMARHVHRLGGYITLADALGNDPSPDPPRGALKDLPRPFKDSPLVRQCVGSPPVNIVTVEKVDEGRDDYAVGTPRHSRLTRSMMTFTNLGEIAEDHDEKEYVPRHLNRSASAGSTPGHSKRSMPSLSLDLGALEHECAEIDLLPDSEPEDEHRTTPKRRPTFVPAPAAEPNEIADLDEKKRKMDYYAPHCTAVNDFISVGGKLVAQDYDKLVSNGVTHILNCVGDVCENYHEGKTFKYLKLYLLDSIDQDITCIVYDCFRFVEDARLSGGRVFIHCQQGVSRSTIVTIAYLILHLSKDYDECYDIVREKRQVCRPNHGFMCQLVDWQKRLRGESRGSVLLYRIGPFHSTRDRLRIVAKLCERVAPSSLDSRTVFVLSTPQANYIWVGRGCQLPEYFLEIAKRHVRCMQQFEHAPDVTHIVYEANGTAQSEAFWAELQCPAGELPMPINPQYDAEYAFDARELAALKRMLIALTQGEEKFCLDFYRDRSASQISLDGQLFRERMPSDRLSSRGKPSEMWERRPSGDLTRERKLSGDVPSRDVGSELTPARARERKPSSNESRDRRPSGEVLDRRPSAELTAKHSRDRKPSDSSPNSKGSKPLEPRHSKSERKQSADRSKVGASPRESKPGSPDASPDRSKPSSPARSTPTSPDRSKPSSPTKPASKPTSPERPMLTPDRMRTSPDRATPTSPDRMASSPDRSPTSPDRAAWEGKPTPRAETNLLSVKSIRRS